MNNFAASAFTIAPIVRLRSPIRIWTLDFRNTILDRIYDPDWVLIGLKSPTTLAARWNELTALCLMAIKPKSGG